MFNEKVTEIKNKNISKDFINEEQNSEFERTNWKWGLFV